MWRYIGETGAEEEKENGEAVGVFTLKVWRRYGGRTMILRMEIGDGDCGVWKRLGD